MTSRARNILIGYAAGIIAGVSYGTNPLFGKSLLDGGAAVSSVLFFRYLFATIFMGILMLYKRESMRVSPRQAVMLLFLGILFSMSSLTLFASYRYIPAGLATTIVYLYPVFTAIIMLLLKVKPTLQVAISILATMLGVFILTDPLDGGGQFSWTGIALSTLSALSYALYLVFVNRSRLIENISANTITFFALTAGSMLFLCCNFVRGDGLLTGITTPSDWASLVALGIVPTMIALLALGISTKKIGPTMTAVLGVFEPVTAILLGTLVFGEPFTLNIAAGIALCIGAVLFMILSENRSSGSACH